MVYYRGTFSGKCIAGSSVLYRYDHIIILYDLKLQAVIQYRKRSKELFI